MTCSTRLGEAPRLVSLSVPIVRTVPELTPVCWRRVWRGKGAGEQRNRVAGGLGRLPQGPGWMAHGPGRAPIVPGPECLLGMCGVLHPRTGSPARLQLILPHRKGASGVSVARCVGHGAWSPGLCRAKDSHLPADAVSQFCAERGVCCRHPAWVSCGVSP